MGSKILLLVLFIAFFYAHYGEGRMTLSIKDFLLESNDTNVDHSQFFQEAWKALCGAKENHEAKSLVIHADETYTIKPQMFQGPCLSRNLHIQIDGTIEAPKMVKDWGNQKNEFWLGFDKVTGLVINGSGLLHAHGGSWWSSVPLSHRPEAVRFCNCKDIIYNGLTQKDSPKNHISIFSCTNTTLSNLHLIAPANSPNTDGVDISLSHNVHIFDSSIQTGDDCIAVNGGSHDINITRVACGPGHGISIGSLGKGGETDTVQNVKVRHCSFIGTENGARIKTWVGGRGFAKNILYENITLINAKYPIIIDQQYRNSRENCNQEDAAVKVSDVTYKDFRGTSESAIAIKLDCDKKVGCDNILMEHINITSSSPKTPLTSYCQFANVVTHFVNIDVKCHFDENAPSPGPQPPYAQPLPPYAQPPVLSHLRYSI